MKRMIIALSGVVVVALLSIGTAGAQRTPVTTIQAKVTVAGTNTYQQALAANEGRKSCTLQYIAVGGTKGFVFFGTAAPADTTTSFQLTNGQSINCPIGDAVLTDSVWVTATATDIFIVTNQ